MDIVTLDFETFYDSEYSLSRMTTEAYVRDERFETILCSFKVNDARQYWVPQPDVPRALQDLQLPRRAVLVHHAHFDGLILSHHYRIAPKLWLDTLGMARALHGANGRLSLAKLAERYGIGAKGDEVLQAKGMHYADFSPQQLARYGAYSGNDSALTYALAQRMVPQFSRTELEIHDQIIRMCTEPVLELDAELLRTYAQRLRSEKMLLLLQTGAQRADLMSADKFAAMLLDLGVVPPRKISPAWLKKSPDARPAEPVWIHAFAKTDPGMQALQAHPDERVQVLVEARLKNKTTSAERGAERLIAMAGRGAATVYLKYAGASGTHRLSGGDAFNWQSMKRQSDLRRAVRAPDGCQVVVGDSAQIEARVLDWLAGQDDMVDVYRCYDAARGPDPYCVMGAKIYGRTITEDDVTERYISKKCIAEGTLVLTSRGWVPIEQIKTTDKLWDGESWVNHSGLLHNGLKLTLSLCGLWLTPDHLVWCGTQWKEAQLVAHDVSFRSQALAFAAANLPSPDTCVEFGAVLQPLSSGAAADALNIPSTSSTSSNSEVPGVRRADIPLHTVNTFGNTTTLWPTPPTVSVCLTVLARQLHDAIALLISGMQATVAEGFAYVTNGVTIAGPSYAMCKPVPAGIIPSWIWTAKKPTAITSPEISGSSRALLMPKTDGKPTSLLRKLPVYDLLSSGPKNRFMVMSGAGPVIVHNCKLGLGYGMGHERFALTVRGEAKGADGAPLILAPAFAHHVVEVYRTAHTQVMKLHRRASAALAEIARGTVGVAVDYRGIVKTCTGGLVMPGGLKILYPELRYDKAAAEWTFWNGKTREKLYGAKMIENIVQCLARIIVFGQCLATQQASAEHARWVHSVHDEGVFVTATFEAPWLLGLLLHHLRTPPAWAAGGDNPLPLNAKGGFAQRYGQVKT